MHARARATGRFARFPTPEKINRSKVGTRSIDDRLDENSHYHIYKIHFRLFEFTPRRDEIFAFDNNQQE